MCLSLGNANNLWGERKRVNELVERGYDDSELDLAAFTLTHAVLFFFLMRWLGGKGGIETGG